MRLNRVLLAGGLAAAMMTALFPAASAAPRQASATIATAVSTPGRAADDVKLDASRQPVAVLGFLGLKPGMKAADIMAGGGYYTEIMARAVGPKGHVTAFEPVQFMPSDDKDKAAWAALMARNPNVTQTAYPFDKFAAASASLDFAMLHLTYHDLYWQSDKLKVPQTDPAAFLATLYAAMKPGGTVGVVDHVAAPGDTRATVDKLHRIDPATIRADFLKAGFVLDGESDLLRNTTDDRSTLVFVPAVRGKTDRVVMRFRKPGRK